MAQSFVFTDEHRKLLKRMCVDWGGDEFGAPAIDPKRPYGNSDVYGDMCEILGIEEDLEIIEDILASTEKLDALHRETMTALTIMLQCGFVLTGRYTSDDPYDPQWHLEVEPRA